MMEISGTCTLVSLLHHQMSIVLDGTEESFWPSPSEFSDHQFDHMQAWSIQVEATGIRLK